MPAGQRGRLKVNSPALLSYVTWPLRQLHPHECGLRSGSKAQDYERLGPSGLVGLGWWPQEASEGPMNRTPPEGLGAGASLRTWG